MDRTHSSINSLLEQATCIARRSKEAAGETESTEGYKRRQTEELIKFANDNGLWIDLSHLNITYIDRGGENEVFHDGNVSVVKLNNFEYAGDDLENFFIRIAAHNKFFGNVPYQMIGFAYNSQQEFCAVLVQPYILAERELLKMKLPPICKHLALKWTITTNTTIRTMKCLMQFPIMYFMA